MRIPRSRNRRADRKRGGALLALAGIAFMSFPVISCGAPGGGLEHGLVKIRPVSAYGGHSSLALYAARNEYESLQVVLNGPLSGVTVDAGELRGPGGTIPASSIRLSRVGYLNIATASNYEGGTGIFPDALIPETDCFYNEARNAFPFDVPQDENRVVWVDLFVPAGTAPGQYSGTIRIRSSSAPDQELPYTLTVWNFTLPSTASLPTAFGYDGWEVLRGHYGSTGMHDHYDQIVPFALMYLQSALMHRITLPECLDEDWDLYATPRDAAYWNALDARWGDFFEGTDLPFGLRDCRVTSLQVPDIGDTDGERVRFWQEFSAHFRDRGWFDLLFDYTFDEPGDSADYQAIQTRAALVHQADPDLRVLVTTDIQEAAAYNVQTVIDLWVPIINAMDGKPHPICWDPQGEYAGDQRADYNGVLTGGAELWWYQSCMSHGCSGSDPDDQCESEYPSYMIDHSAARNRVMSWMTYLYDVHGELYFAVNYCDSEGDAWSDQFYFGGNGDGTLFYPGKPAVIGGTHNIPIESIRLKEIRDGMEDYEYFLLLEGIRGRATVLPYLLGVITDAYTYSDDPDAYLAVRRQIGEAISLSGADPETESGDYNGDGTADIAVFRATAGLWAIRGISRFYFGTLSDNPVPGDYNGDGTSDAGIFRGSSGLWAIRGVSRAYFGLSSDTAVSGDYNGDGTSDIGIFRGSSGLWAIRGVSRAYFGTAGDTVTPGDYDGDGSRDIALFRGSSGLWAIRGVSRIYFGSGGDSAVPGDFNGDGTWGAGIFRPDTGLWAIRGVTRSYFGSASDRPVQADYSGDSTDNIGIFRGASGLWAIRGVSRVYFGTTGDVPVTR